ncbi:uncharacterized protein PV09_05907 [Verruconis gallopava]|uniref:Calpain catalytic domain-containing protein n=1 Tax=Verruconis gallopava TaxID=253628 RepID=A0A0D2A7W4_9PEZI|nr:uncharacterized protein PV09_05907 [Verruconis gallopava]KIW02853.1 hypothetical protein PV09_05907 [Verruconis gallopava]
MERARDLDALRVEITRLEAQIRATSSAEQKLKLTIEATEVAMRAMKLAPSKSAEQAELRSKAQGMLEEAETLKRAKSAQAARLTMRLSPQDSAKKAAVEPSSAGRSAVNDLMAAFVGRPGEPRPTRELTTAEKVLLMRGSKLNGFKFSPWGSTPTSRDFDLDQGQERFVDDADLRLSREQLKHFDGWKPASEAMPPPNWSSEDGLPLRSTTDADAFVPVDLVQDATTDCSVVASLCAGAARAKKGHQRLLADVIFPNNREERKPVVSPNGKYIVKLNFNGCYRRVVIDDRLPVSKTKRVLHVVDLKNPSLLWPAMLEKAYLKVRGGYDFPGSNSATDLWMLCGWIPEQMILQDPDTDLTLAWSRMVDGWRKGDVLITMGTGQISAKVEREDGLASEHDYAVLDLFDDGENQLVLLKNPWREGRSWAGSITGLENIPSLSPQLLPPGTFWIPWNYVQQHFESIYCNWNPCHFSYREDIHFSWDLRTGRSAGGSFANNPQFAVKTRGRGDVWFLLCRHFQDATSTSAGEDENVSVNASGSMTGHINIYVYDRGGEKVYVSSTPLERGQYVDAPQTLVRLSSRAAERTFTVVVSEQNLPAIKQNFSLTVFGEMPVELAPATNRRYPYSAAVAAGWTSSCAGGRSGTVSYFSNPMFKLQLSKRSDIRLLLETFDNDVSVNLKLVHGGKRILELNKRDLITDSGDYRRGSAFAEALDVDAGTYTIVCSTFDQNQRAAFTLRVDASEKPGLEQLPFQHAGRISKRLPGAVMRAGVTKIGAPISPLRLMTMSASISGYTSTPLRLSIVMRPGPNGRILCVSGNGEFSDGRTSAVRLPDMNTWPKTQRTGEFSDMWLFVERLSGNTDLEEEYAVDIICDGRPDDCVNVGEWRVFD